MNYDSEMLQEIAQKVDIVEYASHTFELKQRGNEYCTHCPKHTDNTPSLIFYPETNTFCCYSCRRHGDIISFLVEYENLKFPDAVEKAAKLADIDISKICASEIIAFLRQVKNARKPRKPECVHEIVPQSEYEKYVKALPKEWLDEGIKPEVLDLFDVRIDEIYNRIVYPVRDADGNLINIKGRTRNPLYKKLGIKKYSNYRQVGSLDYLQGLDITKSYINKAGEIIVFESIKSVMKAFGWGFKNCVSVESHALTDAQIRLIISLRANVVIAFDSDINYKDKALVSAINKLKRITNVFVITDKDKLLGGAEAKNAPVDLGEEIWLKLYENKRKVI